MGDPAHYGYSDDGRRRYQSGQLYTAVEKSEELIVETHARRVRHCWDPARDIVQENDLQSMLKEWKDGYRVWMRPESLQGAERM